MRTTQADEYRDDAREAVDKACVCLSKIVVERCDGSDEYKPEYRAKLQDLFLRLLTLRDEM